MKTANLFKMTAHCANGVQFFVYPVRRDMSIYRKFIGIVAAVLLAASSLFAQSQVNLGPPLGSNPPQVKGVIQPVNQYVYVGDLSGLPVTCHVGADAFITNVTAGQNDY